MQNNNYKRKLELSSKFLEMGQSLLKEGQDSKDYVISQSGNFMILIAGLMLDEEDIYLFAQLCAMFSAKKILDNLEQNKSGLTEYLKNKANSESYEDIIKRINKFREDNDIPPMA